MLAPLPHPPGHSRGRDVLLVVNLVVRIDYDHVVIRDAPLSGEASGCGRYGCGGWRESSLGGSAELTFRSLYSGQLCIVEGQIELVELVYR